MGCYCSAKIVGPEVITTMIPEYGMRGDSVLVPLLHLFVVQRRLMSGAWTHLSASGYAERTVRARSAGPDGLPLTGEDK
jgi:hypothetical protein